MQIKGDLRWKYAGGSIAVTAGKKSSCIQTCCCPWGFFATGFSENASEDQYFHVDVLVENGVEDEQRALAIG